MNSRKEEQILKMCKGQGGQPPPWQMTICNELKVWFKPIIAFMWGRFYRNWTMNISIGSVSNTMHKKMGYRKTCSHYLLQHLSDVNKTTRMRFCLESLMQYHEESIPFLCHIIAGDETWVKMWQRKHQCHGGPLYFSPPIRNSKWSMKEVMARIFWYH